MWVRFYSDLSNYDKVELNATSFREILSLSEFLFGSEFTKKIKENKYYYILRPKDGEEPVLLSPEVLGCNFNIDDTLYIIPNIEGESPAILAFSTGLLEGLGVSAATAAVAAPYVASVVTIGLSMGFSYLMSALSPTPSFSSDPAYSQNKSNLFNGAPILMEQGGAMPLVFGNPYCGGVLISSGIFSEQS